MEPVADLERLQQLQRQAVDGDVTAQYLLGDYYFSRICRAPETECVEDEIENALVWLRKAAVAGHVEAQYLLAVTLELNIDPEQAITWYTLAAGGGQVQAMLNLANFWLDGRGWRELPCDPRQAFEWFSRAAELGSAQARFELARMYRDGNHVERDPGEYLRLATLAAEEGLPEGQIVVIAAAVAAGEFARAEHYLNLAAAGRAAPWGAVVEQVEAIAATCRSPRVYHSGHPMGVGQIGNAHNGFLTPMVAHNETVLVMYDDSPAGDGSTGCAIGSNRLAWSTAHGIYFRPFSWIGSLAIRAEAGALVLDDGIKVGFSQLDAEDCKRLEIICRLLAKVEISEWE